MGVVTALVSGWPLVVLTGMFAAAGALIGAVTADGGNSREAVIDALPPLGTWLVGAAVGWVMLASFRDQLPQFVQRYPSEATLVTAVIGGTLAVVILMTRLGRRTG